MLKLGSIFFGKKNVYVTLYVFFGTNISDVMRLDVLMFSYSVRWRFLLPSMTPFGYLLCFSATEQLLRIVQNNKDASCCRQMTYVKIEKIDQLQVPYIWCISGQMLFI